MKKRNVFWIFLLCLAALLILSACASRNADTAAPSEPHEATSVSTPPETPADTEETPTYADTKEQPIVTMTIWSYDVDKEFAYTLTPEDSSRVIAIFEGAEKEVHDVPLSMAVSMEFRWGRDRMSTSPESLDTLDGDLNGESTLLTLDAAACIELRQIITNYANADMPSEWPDTPSAGCD